MRTGPWHFRLPHERYDMKNMVPRLEQLEGRIAPALWPVTMTAMHETVEARTLEGGEAGVVADRFWLHAGRYVRVDSLAYAVQGNAGDVASATLWQDRDRNGTFETRLKTVQPTGGGIIFDPLNRFDPHLQRRMPGHFQVTIDIAANPAGDMLGIDLRQVVLHRPWRGVLQEHGREPLHVIDHASETGNLFAITDTTPVRSMHMLGGTGDATGQRIEFRAQGEDIDVYTLKFLVAGNADGRSIDRLALYRPGEPSPFAFATVGAWGSDFMPSTLNGEPARGFAARMPGRQLVIDDGLVTDVIVKPVMKTDSDGGVSGDQFLIALYDVEARGMMSSNNLVDNDGDALAEGEVFIGTSTPGPDGPVVGPRHTVVMSKLTAVTNVNPDADGTNVPTGVSNVGQFKLQAASNVNTLYGLNRFDAMTMVFIVEATNVALDLNAFRVFNKSDPGTSVPASYEDLGSGRYRVTAQLESSAVNAQLASGENGTFVLRLLVTNPKVNSAQTSLLRVGIDLSALAWYDRDALGSTFFVGTDLPDSIVWSTRYES
ncbi:MAG: hypothetical protein G01um101425_255 [Candidatus Peregrinibacteria bacterium Gr01-1014_25]|nr:MAG: hypothetical protein G01um101425_255 [Candidatus Peregrinibacteria bacterium Gr01-1014_25]